uniref:Uncharacterized protein n=1 Tax=Ascaris lumbricoides TaxID=6252 RepID=A0A0M3HGK3_ASCLU
MSIEIEKTADIEMPNNEAICSNVVVTITTFPPPSVSLQNAIDDQSEEKI